MSAGVESTLLLLQDQNAGIRGELNLLKNENRMLKDRLNALGFSLEQRLESPHKALRLPSFSPEPISFSRGGEGDCGAGAIRHASAPGSARGSTEDLLNDARGRAVSPEAADSECSEA